MITMPITPAMIRLYLSVRSHHALIFMKATGPAYRLDGELPGIPQKVLILNFPTMRLW